MPRRFDKRGWNRQFKWQPVRRGRWDPFPKDHLPFVDDFSIISVLTKEAAEPDDMDTDTPAGGTKRPRPEDDSPDKQKQKILQRNRKIRAENAARKLHYEKTHGHGPLNKGKKVSMSHHEKVTNRLFYAGLGLAAVGAGAALEGAAIGGRAQAAAFRRANGISFGRLLRQTVRDMPREIEMSFRSFRRSRGYHLD